jgi:anthranilate phosphoribosyltransferase
MTSETTPALVRKLMSRQDLTRAESAELLEDLLRHDTEGWKLLAYSVASQTKGETVDELLGIWDAMYRLTGDYDLDLKGRRPMEVASAGSSGVRKINVSTLMALVVGEPAVPVLKHSFWKITGIAGSADVLASVGIFAPAATLPKLQRALDEVGVAFYSPIFVSPELVHLVNFGRILGEKQLGIPTPFNLMVPIFTPVPLVYRMFGLNNPHQFEMLTAFFRGIGYRNGLLVRGSDGLDEATITGPSRVRGFRNGEELDFTLEPEQAGLRTAPREAIAPVDARSNTRDFLRIAHGLEKGPKRDLVALNCGLALWLSEQAPSIEEGVRTAIGRLDSGEVGRKLRTVVELTGDPDILRLAEEEHLAP